MKITGVLIFTDDGIYSIVATPCSNGATWTAENCYRYINNEKGWQEHQAEKLKWLGSLITDKTKKWSKWYLDRHNFVDTFEIEI